MPNCPPLIKQVETALSQFNLENGQAFSPSPNSLTKTEAMDEFSSKGWERGEHMAILELRQSPRVILGVVLERKRALFRIKETLLTMIMTEKTVSTPSETASTWQPVVCIMTPTVATLVEDLGHLVREGFLARTDVGLVYTGKRLSDGK